MLAFRQRRPRRATTLRSLGRPSEIARQSVAMVTLLDLASEEPWLVRLEYTAGPGREEQVTAAVTEVGPRKVDIQCLPRWDARSVPLSALRWVRILTAAEERVLL